MYGLKQAANIAYNHIILHMAPCSYYPATLKTGLQSHKTRKTKFCLCVDDFGVKYFSKDDENHHLDPKKKELCNFNVLTGTQLPRIDNRLEIQRGIRRHLNARLCEKRAGSGPIEKKLDHSNLSKYSTKTLPKHYQMCGLLSVQFVS